jgi:hypothetical protein
MRRSKTDVSEKRERMEALATDMVQDDLFEVYSDLTFNMWVWFAGLGGIAVLVRCSVHALTQAIFLARKAIFAAGSLRPARVHHGGKHRARARRRHQGRQGCGRRISNARLDGGAGNNCLAK